MNTLLSIICAFILIFFLKDIITLIIALFILSFCFYFLTENNYISN